MKTVLLIGSNEGERERYISEAMKMLEQNKIFIIRKSSLIETLPEECPSQRKFLNIALVCKTELSPLKLLEITQLIEKKLGRKSKGDLYPRTIDIDIIFYGDKVFVTENLQVPHPRFHKRYFAVKLLSEVCPDQVHPLMGKSVKQLFKEHPGQNFKTN